MTETMRDVLAEPVEIRGGLLREYEANRNRGARFPIGKTFAGGGYTVGIYSADSGVGRVELREHGPDTKLMGADFEHEDYARAEFDRLVNQLRERERVQFMVDLAERGDILPAEFLGVVRTGEVGALLVAADYQEEAGEADKSLLLRAAYYQLTGEKGVTIKAGKSLVVMNPARLSVAVVTPGKSIRVVATKETSEKMPTGGYGLVRRMTVREFEVGDMAEYGSYNLVYYGPIKSITAKTVVVAERYANPGTHPTRRLKIADFVSKNYDFDLAAARWSVAGREVLGC